MEEQVKPQGQEVGSRRPSIMECPVPESLKGLCCDTHECSVASGGVFGFHLCPFLTLSYAIDTRRPVLGFLLGDLNPF